MTKLNFWLNSASIHQAPLISSLAGIDDLEVAVVCDSGVSPSRLRLGWGLPDFGNALTVVSPNPEERRKLENELLPGSVNIASGLDVYEGVSNSAREGRKRGELVLYQTENFDERGAKGRIRRLQLRRRLPEFRRRRDVLLGMGQSADRQLETAGYPSSLIREFAYFPSVASPTRVSESAEPTEKIGSFNVGYVGSLNNHKNVPALIRVLRRLGPPFVLTLVGDGPLRTNLERLGKNIVVVGPVEHTRVPQLIESFDLLVLPSLYDGWGAVVNEALLCGTPAVVSSASGAACLIKPGVNGFVFDPRDDDDLARCITKVREQAMGGIMQRSRIQRDAASAISPFSGAEYLLRIIDGIKGGGGVPDPPWR